MIWTHGAEPSIYREEVDLFYQGQVQRYRGRWTRQNTSEGKKQIIPRLGSHKYFPKDLWVRTEGVTTRNNNKELLFYNKNKTNRGCCHDKEPEEKLLTDNIKSAARFIRMWKKWRSSKKVNTWEYLENLRAGTDLSIL